MFDRSLFSGRQSEFPIALEQIQRLWEADLPLYSNLSNVSALLAQCLERTNWVGFYLWEPRLSCLILGPFQGLPACTRIPLGIGVCGTALAERRTQLVPDVHLFPGHIACDAASRSEIAVPLLSRAAALGAPAGHPCLGVLDVDSPEVSRFGAADQSFLAQVAAALAAVWPAASG